MESGFSEGLCHLVQEHLWTQHVDSFTRVRPGQNPSLLDLILTNEVHHIDTIHYLPPLGLSDHLLLQFDLLCYWANAESSRKLRCFPKADFPGLLAHLQRAFSHSVCGTPSEKYEHICHHIKYVDEKFIPRVDQRLTDKPPLPRYIRRLLDRRAQSFAHFKNNGSDATEQEFKRVRNECKMAIRTFFKRRQNRILETAKRNKHALYNFLRRQKKNHPTPFALHDSAGLPLENPLEIGNIFRDHFAIVYGDKGPLIHPNVPPRSFVEELNTVSFTVQDVERELQSINVFSAMGPDNIHPRILKEGASILSSPFYDLFRQTLDGNSLPDVWKTALVTPIYKGGDRRVPGSYRPVSLTSIPCKVLERLIKKGILQHLLLNKLISSTQHGFMPNRSCVTNLLLFMDSLTDAYDKGLISDAIFFDFAKAFDRVPHQPLLY
jgi:hypothetical protein